MTNSRFSLASVPPLRPPAQAIWLAGFMAAGKTEVGLRLAERLGVPFVDTDAAIERTSGRRISEIFRANGEEIFRQMETAALEELASAGPRVVATGGGAMTRPANVELMRRSGPIVWLRVSPEDVLKRTAGDTTRPLLDVEDPAERVEELLRLRRPFYELADYTVDTSGRSVVEVVTEVLEILAVDPRVCALVRELPLNLWVNTPDSQYPIVVGHGLFDGLGEVMDGFGIRPTSAAIVTAQGPCREYAERICERLIGNGWHVGIIAVPDTESSKSLAELGRLYEEFVRLDLDRRSVVFAVGGGMVGDLAGTAAATFMRGIRLIQVPTTMLAQIDSSIGGKTAVNLPVGKNVVGAFHQPSAVIACLDVLSTLHRSQLLDGLAEGIKHALIWDADLFEWIEGNWERVIHLEPWAVRYFVARNAQIKAGVVSQDVQETHLRTLLNFGHTVGHALERAAEDWHLSHGQAVAVGMLAELEIGVRMGLTQKDVWERVYRLMCKMGFARQAVQVDFDAAATALGVDKKMAAGRLKLPVVIEPGCSAIISNVAPEVLLDALRGPTG